MRLLIRPRADVRQYKYIRNIPQRTFRWQRLFSKYIQRCAFDAATLQTINQSFFINDWPAPDVEKVRMRRQSFERIFVNQAFGVLVEWQRHHRDIALRQHLFELFDAKPYFWDRTFRIASSWQQVACVVTNVWIAF